MIRGSSGRPWLDAQETYKQLNGHGRHQGAEENDANRLDPSPTLQCSFSK